MTIPDTFTPKLLSILRQGYDFQTFRADVIAGLTVAVVALPLAMALGIASGASPDKGLITAVIAGFLISLLGGSRVQIGGPTGAFIVVVFGVIADHGYDGLLLATLLAGVILIVAGYARFGQVIKYIPYPVITGFTAGIAVIIATSQIKDFLGLHVPNEPAQFIPKWQNYFTHIDTASLATLIVGTGCLAIILLMRRILPKWPAYLVAVIIGAGVVYGLSLPVDTIGSRFGAIAVSFPAPSLPAWDFDKLIALFPSAITIAFLAGIEALLSATVADGMTGYKHRPNQELVGQGVANIVSGLFGGLPATGAIARTATNIKSGGKTPIAGIVHALFLLIFLLFLGKAMGFIPLAALAAILFIVAWNMSEIHHFIHIARLSARDRLVMILTFLLTVLVDLTVAIGVGVTIASLLFMQQMSLSTIFKYQGRKIRDIAEDQTQRNALPKGVEVLRLTGPLFFGMADTMMDTLRTLGDRPSVIIFRMKHVPYMDTAGLKAFRQLLQACRDKNRIVILSGLTGQPADILERDGITANNQTLYVVPRYDDAITLSRTLAEKRGKA